VRYLYKSESYSIPQRLFFIPLKETIIFPYVVAPLFFQSDEALAILNKVILENSLIGCVGQRDPHLKDPQPKDLLSVGTVCKPVPHEMAMTGELTLSGRVLPVGGIKEKILVARRAGVKTVILPKRNEENLDDIPDYIKREINLVLVEHIQEVLDLTLPS
jgi:ATP-dependent Lon protease